MINGEKGINKGYISWAAFIASACSLIILAVIQWQSLQHLFVKDSISDDPADKRNWHTYRNDAFGFEFKYPDQFEVSSILYVPNKALEIRISPTERVYTDQQFYFVVEVTKDNGFDPSLTETPNQHVEEMEDVIINGKVARRTVWRKESESPETNQQESIEYTFKKDGETVVMRSEFDKGYAAQEALGLHKTFQLF